MKGKVFSGNKKGKKFVNLPWVKKQIKEKLGFEPYIGTLNLRLLNEKNIIKLSKTKGITIIPRKGYVRGKCFKALVEKKIEGAVVFPNVQGYLNNVLEVLAPVNLRNTLGLKDGDTVEIIIKFE